MKNNVILLTPDRCQRVEGYIGGSETPKPGTAMQIDYTGTLIGNRPPWVAYNRDADGNRPLGPIIILDMDIYQGRLATDAYAAGERCFGFVPLAGCEANVLFGNAAGTADDVVAGTTLLIPNDGDGKWIPTASTPEVEPALALESISDPTADQLIHAIFTGYSPTPA